MPGGYFPKTILFFFNGGAGLSLQGNSVGPKWPLKLKTVEKFKGRHEVIGDKQFHMSYWV